MSDPRRTLAQAERRLRYVMERHGITRAGLKVVPHGLRHQDAADAYRALAGHPRTVVGGCFVDIRQRACPFVARAFRTAGASL